MREPDCSELEQFELDQETAARGKAPANGLALTDQASSEADLQPPEMEQTEVELEDQPETEQQRNVRRLVVGDLTDQASEAELEPTGVVQIEFALVEQLETEPQRNAQQDSAVSVSFAERVAFAFASGSAPASGPSAAAYSKPVTHCDPHLLVDLLASTAWNFEELGKAFAEWLGGVLDPSPVHEYTPLAAELVAVQPLQQSEKQPFVLETQVALQQHLLSRRW